MKLASGVCRVPDMLALGVPVGLAVDGSASNDCSNLLAEIRAAYLLHRLTYSAKAPTGYDLLKMATMGSARLLGRQDEIGTPFCITLDFETVGDENTPADHCVTIRERDTMNQVRIPIDQVKSYLEEKIKF